MQQDLKIETTFNQNKLESALLESEATMINFSSEEKRIQNQIEEDERNKTPVLVRTDSNKVLKDGKRYHIDKNNDIISLNDRSNFKLG